MDRALLPDWIAYLDEHNALVEQFVTVIDAQSNDRLLAFTRGPGTPTVILRWDRVLKLKRGVA